MMADRLLQKRKALGLSRRKLALAVGVSDTHIENLEKGTVDNPGYWTVRKIAHELGVSDYWLMGVEDGTSTPGQELARQWEGLAEEERKVVAEMVRILGKPRDNVVYLRSMVAEEREDYEAKEE